MNSMQVQDDLDMILNYQWDTIDYEVSQLHPEELYSFDEMFKEEDNNMIYIKRDIY